VLPMLIRLPMQERKEAPRVRRCVRHGTKTAEICFTPSCETGCGDTALLAIQRSSQRLSTRDTTTPNCQRAVRGACEVVARLGRVALPCPPFRDLKNVDEKRSATLGEGVWC
jgi:hypothetical protein